MKLVVGLGNPGKEYENTKHNIGFIALDHFAEKQGIVINSKKFDSLTSELILNNEKIILLKPQTYMNLSGQAVAKAVNFYKIPLENIIVLFDDLDLEPGTIRFRKNGSAGGHNGIKSIIENLSTAEFARIKIGIGRPKNKNLVTKYVLSKLTQAGLQKDIELAIKKLEEWLNLL